MNSWINTRTSGAARNLTTLVLAGGQFGRPYVMPPKTPADRVKIIREAFEKVLGRRIGASRREEKKTRIRSDLGRGIGKTGQRCDEPTSGDRRENEAIARQIVQLFAGVSV